MSNEQECVEKFNKVMHALLDYDAEASWADLDDSMIELAHSTATNFLKSWPGNFIAKSWLGKIADFKKRVQHNQLQVQEKRPSVFRLLQLRLLLLVRRKTILKNEIECN